MEAENRRAYIGHAKDVARRKGWLFGSFMDEPQLNSDMVEVAWQHLSDVRPSPDQAHFHTDSVEINLVTRGTIELSIDGERHDLQAGDFYVIWPHCVVADIVTGPDTELVVVRAPSRNDKVQIDGGA